MQVYAWTKFQLVYESVSPNLFNKTKDSLAQGDLLHHTTSIKRTKNQTKAPTTHDSSDLFHVDKVLSNAKFSQSNASLYVFEDNEAVIKVIIKGRSPKNPQSCSFIGCLTESTWTLRFNTKHQIADILTKGNFTRDEWNNLLHLLNISHFSSTCFAKNSSSISCPETMAKRMQEQKKKQDCGEIQADGDDPGQLCSYKFFICEQSD